MELYTTGIYFHQLLTIPLFLCITALWGICFTSSNAISVIIAFELLLLSVSLFLVSFSLYLQDINGYLFAILLLPVAGAETAIGLALIVNLYTQQQFKDLTTIIGLKV